MILFEISIEGRLPVKKNTARHWKYGVQYSKVWKAWEKQAVMKIHEKIGKGVFAPIEKYCHLDLQMHFKSHQWEADVSNLCEGPQDVLESTGVLKNDKFIKKLTAEKHFSGIEVIHIKLIALETHEDGSE